MYTRIKLAYTMQDSVLHTNSLSSVSSVQYSLLHCNSITHLSLECPAHTVSRAKITR